MRPVFYALSLLLLLSACSDSRKSQQILDTAGGFPATFDSVEAAREWMNRIPTGGRIDQFRLGWRSHLVVFQHGSGIPVTGIGVYQRRLFRWKLISKHGAPPPPREHLRAETKDGKIVLIGMPSGRMQPLPKPE